MDLMIDIETLGTAPGCALVSLAAVPFDRGAKDPASTDFYVTLDLGSCAAAGLVIEPATVAWWMERADRWPGGEKTTPLPEALRLLSLFIASVAPGTLWGHGAPFDFPILAAAYRAVGLKLPWHRGQLRDTRTLFDLAGHQFTTTAHHALTDAREQAQAVQRAMQMLRGVP